MKFGYDIFQKSYDLLPKFYIVIAYSAYEGGLGNKKSVRKKKPIDRGVNRTQS